MALTEGLETIPRKVVEYRGARIEEMDTDAILRRRPGGGRRRRVSAHRTCRAPARTKRWEDVHVLLDAGHRRADDDERAASREPERSDLAEHRRAGARNDPGLGAAAGGRSRDGRPHAARADQQAEARRGVPFRQGAESAGKLLSRARRSSPCASWRCGRRRTRSRAASQKRRPR